MTFEEARYPRITTVNQDRCSAMHAEPRARSMAIDVRRIDPMSKASLVSCSGARHGIAQDDLHSGSGAGCMSAPRRSL